MGASCEGNILGNIVLALEVEERDCYFSATHTGAELDMVIRHGTSLQEFEIK